MERGNNTRKRTQKLTEVKPKVTSSEEKEVKAEETKNTVTQQEEKPSTATKKDEKAVKPEKTSEEKKEKKKKKKLKADDGIQSFGKYGVFKDSDLSFDSEYYDVSYQEKGSSKTHHEYLYAKSVKKAEKEVLAKHPGAYITDVEEMDEDRQRDLGLIGNPFDDFDDDED